MTRVVELIYTESTRGKGTPEDPVHRVLELWSKRGVWAVLKRGIHGVYHHVTAKHLDRYVQEAAQQPDQQAVSDLTSALVNMGMANKKKAAAIATQAAAAGGTLPEMIIRATQAARVN